MYERLAIMEKTDDSNALSNEKNLRMKTRHGKVYKSSKRMKEKKKMLQ